MSHRLPVFFCLFTLWSVTAHSATVPVAFQQRNAQPESYWHSPCGASAIGPFAKTVDWTQLHNLLDKWRSTADMISDQAELKKNQLLKVSFNDPSFEDIYRSAQHNWLPKPPTGAELENELDTINIETAFRQVYRYLQHYAVGLEQASLDQEFANEGRFANLFREIQNSLRQFLCDLDMSIHLLKIQKDPDVSRDVMSVMQRKLSGDHKITLRDYIILRDYIHMLRYVDKLFGYLANHPERRPAGVPLETVSNS